MTLEQIAKEIIAEVEYKNLNGVIEIVIGENWKEELEKEGRKESKYFWNYLKLIAEELEKEY